jgi:flagellar motor protein MotB
MGFGSSDPVVANDTAENKQKNRRVDIFVSDAEGTGNTTKQ